MLRKLESGNPGGSVKDRIALAMVEQLQALEKQRDELMAKLLGR